jgi:hypothetical protein
MLCKVVVLALLDWFLRDNGLMVAFFRQATDWRLWIATFYYLGWKRAQANQVLNL